MLEDVRQKAPPGQQAAWLEALSELMRQRKTVDLAGLNRHRSALGAEELASIQLGGGGSRWSREQISDTLAVAAHLTPECSLSDRRELEKMLGCVGHRRAKSFLEALGDRPDKFRWVGHLTFAPSPWSAAEPLQKLAQLDLPEIHDVVEGLGLTGCSELATSLARHYPARWLKETLAHDNPRAAAGTLQALAQGLPDGLDFPTTAELLLQKPAVPADATSFLLERLAKVGPEARPERLQLLLTHLRRLGPEKFLQGWDDKFLAPKEAGGGLQETAQGLKLGGVMLRKRS